MEGHHGGCALCHTDMLLQSEPALSAAISSAPCVLSFCQTFQTKHGLACSEHTRRGVTGFLRHWVTDCCSTGPLPEEFKWPETLGKV